MGQRLQSFLKMKNPFRYRNDIEEALKLMVDYIKKYGLLPIW